MEKKEDSSDSLHLQSHYMHRLYSKESFLVKEAVLSDNQLFLKFNSLFNLPLGKQNQQELIQA